MSIRRAASFSALPADGRYCPPPHPRRHFCWRARQACASFPAMRLDQWLWAVRAFHSRNQAAAAIREGRVLIDGVPGKPAHEVQPPEVVTIFTRGEERMLRVLGAPRSRVGAKLVPTYAARVDPI